MASKIKIFGDNIILLSYTCNDCTSTSFDKYIYTYEKQGSHSQGSGYHTQAQNAPHTYIHMNTHSTSICTL